MLQGVRQGRRHRCPGVLPREVRLLMAAVE
jgi:hypothetical protein